MSQSLRKSISALCIAGAMLLFGVLMLFLPKTVVPEKRLSSSLNAVPKADYNISIPDAGAFSYNNLGLYLTRPVNGVENNVYTGTISTAELIAGKTEFYPDFTALIMRDDQWFELADSNDFWIEENDPTNYSVTWCLRETAPAAVYGVRCAYQEESNGEVELIEIEFQVLYTEDWTYINVTNNDGVSRITNFSGGSELTLPLNVTFNDGAAEPDLYEKGDKLLTGTSIGSLYSGCVVSTEAMLKNIVVKTVSGKVYSAKNVVSKIDPNVNNRVELRFLEPLENDIYIVQFTSDADSRIMGQFVIDNTSMRGGVNLSQLWVVLMIFGGFLALGASSAFFIPLVIVKINENRVNKENERVARMKNPEAYASKKKKSLKEMIDNVIYYIKTPAYKRKKDAKEKTEEQEEEKVYSNRFTEMLRERREKRDFMREHNVTSEEMERMKEKEEAIAADEANSFAALRDDDDDDEIATFHAAEDEVSTLETGAYVEGGARFAKLDSIRDDEDANDGNKHD